MLGFFLKDIFQGDIRPILNTFQILPWNLREEVKAQLNYVREWGCKFVTAVPTLQVE